MLPLILRYIDMPHQHIHILTADDCGMEEVKACGVDVTIAPVTRDNCHDLLIPMVGAGDFLLNLSVDVPPVALIKLCRQLHRSVAHSVAVLRLRVARACTGARPGLSSSTRSPSMPESRYAPDDTRPGEGVCAARASGASVQPFAVGSDVACSVDTNCDTLSTS